MNDKINHNKIARQCLHKTEENQLKSRGNPLKTSPYLDRIWPCESLGAIGTAAICSGMLHHILPPAIRSNTRQMLDY